MPRTRKTTKSKPNIKTATPSEVQIVDIKEIEGIGKEYYKDLKYKAGISTTEDLRKASLVEVVEATNISPVRVYKWQCISDLFRLKRAAQEWTELLFEVGVETVKEVSKQKASDLHNKIENFYKKAKRKAGWRGSVKKIPTVKDVETWIKSAKELIETAEAQAVEDIKTKLKIVSKAPAKGQVVDIEKIEGIGPNYAKKLKEVGIENTEQLRLSPLVVVVEATDLSPKLLFKWICQADLFRVEDVGEEYADLLFYAGIQTVKKLSKQKVRDLLNRIRRAAKLAKEEGGWAGDVSKLPGEKTVKTWIMSARELVKRT